MAAQNRLNAPVLFSHKRVSDLLDPALKTSRLRNPGLRMPRFVESESKELPSLSWKPLAGRLSTVPVPHPWQNILCFDGWICSVLPQLAGRNSPQFAESSCRAASREHCRLSVVLWPKERLQGRLKAYCGASLGVYRLPSISLWRGMMLANPRDPMEMQLGEPHEKLPQRVGWNSPQFAESCHLEAGPRGVI